jgi:hypothetical protein
VVGGRVFSVLWQGQMHAETASRAEVTLVALVEVKVVLV